MHRSFPYPSTRFGRLARWTAWAVGHQYAFALALSVVLLWLLAGFWVGFTDTFYQLLINTGTTIVTFLMVFLVQNTQNRDSAALHLKLDELLRANGDAHNALLDLEELEMDELESLRDRNEALAREARALLRKAEDRALDT